MGKQMTGMGKLRLGVNSDHVATVRNARRSDWPDPLRAALLAEAAQRLKPKHDRPHGGDDKPGAP